MKMSLDEKIQKAFQEDDWEEFTKCKKSNEKEVYKYYNWKLAKTKFEKNIALKLCKLSTPIYFDDTEMLSEWITLNNGFFESEEEPAIMMEYLSNCELNCFKIILDNCDLYNSWDEFEPGQIHNKDVEKTKIFIKHQKIIEIFKKECPDVFDTFLDDMTYHKCEEEIKILIRIGINYTYRENHQYNRTLFSELLNDGKYDSILLMLQNGFDCEKLEYDKNWSCLSEAIDKGKLSIIKLLIEIGNAKIQHIPFSIMEKTTPVISEYINFKLGKINIKKRKIINNENCIVKKQKIELNELYKRCSKDHYISYIFYDRISCALCNNVIDNDLYINN